MKVIPAIDLLEGRCVRLLRGDFKEATVYTDEPLRLVRDFVSDGARRIHVVDLDAARDAARTNQQRVEEIVHSTGVEVQVGGGIRDESRVEEWFDRGAAYVVVGTLAVEKPEEVRRLARRWPERVLVALDMRGNQVSTHGWEKTGATTLPDLLQVFDDAPLAGFVYTDVERDGTMEGPDLDGLRGVRSRSHHSVLLSGGISSIEHLTQAHQAGAAGAIIGRALYEARLSLKDAVAAVSAAGDQGGARD